MRHIEKWMLEEVCRILKSTPSHAVKLVERSEDGECFYVINHIGDKFRINLTEVDRNV